MVIVIVTKSSSPSSAGGSQIQVMTSIWSPSATQSKTFTLAIRIQFSGRFALEVSSTSQGRIAFLIPRLRNLLTSLRLPHPKSANFVKPYDARGVIDMFWDVEDKGHDISPCPPFSMDPRWTGQPLVNHVINRCSALESSILTEKSM